MAAPDVYNFKRPYLSAPNPVNVCAWCSRVLELSDFCQKCGHRMCPCGNAQKVQPKHDDDACRAQQFDEFPARVVKLLSLKDGMSDKLMNSAMVVAMNLYKKTLTYEPLQDPAEETKRIMSWRQDATEFLALKYVEDVTELERVFPQLNSTSYYLVQNLFTALLLLVDNDDDDALPMPFLVMFYGRMVRQLSFPSGKGANRALNDADSRLFYIAVNAMNEVTRKRDPLIKMIFSCNQHARPLVTVCNAFKRNVVNSFFLLDITAYTEEEEEYMYRQGPKPATGQRSIMVLLFAVKAPLDQTPRMRAIQVHEDFYTLPQWLDGNLPPSTIAGVKTDSSVPACGKALEGMSAIKHYAKMLDTLVFPKSTPLERRDAYASLFGIVVNDATTMPRFSLTCCEANMTH